MTDQDHTILTRRKVLTGTALAGTALPFMTAIPATAQSGRSSMSSPVTDPAFDPQNFPIVPQKRFQDLRVGDIFRAPSRTLTVALTSAFQAVSVDNNPLHYDDDYARRHGKKSALVQPLEVLAFSAPGASLFSLYVGEVLIAWTGLSAQFLKESFVGDTIFSELHIRELTPRDGIGHVTTDIMIHNQRSELVISGQQTFTLRL